MKPFCHCCFYCKQQTIPAGTQDSAGTKIRERHSPLPKAGKPGSQISRKNLHQLLPVQHRKSSSHFTSHRKVATTTTGVGRQTWDRSPSEHGKQPQERRKPTDRMPISGLSPVQPWLFLPYRRPEKICMTIYAAPYPQLLQSNVLLSAFLSQASGSHIRPC